MSKDYLKILKTMPRGVPPRGIAGDKALTEKVRQALEFAASEEGRGLSRKNVWEALNQAGAFERGYRTFAEYCREHEIELWEALPSR